MIDEWVDGWKNGQMLEGERKIRQAQRGQDRRALNVSINVFCVCVSDCRFMAEVVCEKFENRKEVAVIQAWSDEILG